ncbi:MAG TPA: universal stress protein [Gaiellaceae bacterium]
MAHVLVIANETAASKTLLDTLRERAAEDDVMVTVIAPVSEPRQGYVVYDDTRRASARRRLDKTLGLLRASSIPAQGFVVETSPVQAAKDALVQLEPPPDEIVVSTHSPQTSGWLRRNVVQDIERAAGGLPVKHVIAADDAAVEEKNVLVLANETMLSKALLDRIRERAGRGPASFLIVAPQSDDAPHPEADRRLRRALSELRKEGIDAHGQVVHPDPFTAAVHVTHDERVDEIIVSTFPGKRASSWLRGDLIDRLRRETGVPVDHVMAEA